MKKILFLSFAYPYGHFGPSDNCSVKIMKELSLSGEYEIHNISRNKKSDNDSPNYDMIDGVTMHYLPFPEEKWLKNPFVIHLKLFLLIPFYPLVHLWRFLRYYHACRDIIKDNNFDMVIAQCNPQESVLTGCLLRKFGHINNLMVLFWDNIYGKLPHFIPWKFALYRQRKLESWVARNADKLVSLYPSKQFHDEFGDLPEAANKREYLGIPSIVRPQRLAPSSYAKCIDRNKINILYSGTIFKADYVVYLVNLLNGTTYADRINLIFFSRGVSNDDFEHIKKSFNGTLCFYDWIPHKDLLSLYANIDIFISFPGIYTAIRSKVYEYMNYGKPILLLYDHDNDVNDATFSKYPLCISLDQRVPVDENKNIIENCLNTKLGLTVPFEGVESLFPLDTVLAYKKVIDHSFINKDLIPNQSCNISL